MLISSSSHRIAVQAALLAAAVCAFALAPQHARAETTLAGDLDVVAPVDSHYHKTGGGFGIRIGQQLHLPLIALTPEIGFTYANFPANGPNVYRGIAGLNLGIGEIFRFGVMAHVGFGHVSVDTTPQLKLAGEGSHTGFTLDGGLFFELTLLPIINIGVHAAYNRVAGKGDGDPLQWITAGAHVTIVF